MSPQPQRSSFDFFNGSSPLWFKIITTLGPVATIAIWLVWWITSGVSSNLQTVATNIQIEMPARRAEHQRQLELLVEASAQRDIVARYLRVMCINAAETPSQREQCARVE